jgi:hypothetical protein
MVDKNFYDLNRLREITVTSVEYFKGELKDKSEEELKKLLPHPDGFRYLHEFKDYDGVKGGILIVGLNPHLGEKENKEKWEDDYSINKGDDRNTSDLLLEKYRYFTLFTTDKNMPMEKKNYSMNLSKVEPNIKFTDVVLVRTSSKVELIGKLEKDASLNRLIEQGWNKFLKPVIELIQPKAIVCNSTDLSSFLECNYASNIGDELDHVIHISSNGNTIPVILSGQVTGQRAIDKWTLERMKQAIIENLD